MAEFCEKCGRKMIIPVWVRFCNLCDKPKKRHKPKHLGLSVKKSVRYTPKIIDVPSGYYSKTKTYKNIIKLYKKHNPYYEKILFVYDEDNFNNGFIGYKKLN